MTVTRSLVCHMNIVLEDGSTADSTASGKPARLNIGDGTLSPAFEAQLVSLNEGDKHSFTLEAVDALDRKSVV